MTRAFFIKIWFWQKPKSIESQLQINSEFMAEEYLGTGDSDVKAENLRVQKILYEPRNNDDEKPVVLIHVNRVNN